MGLWEDIGHFLTGGATTKKGRNFLFGEGPSMNKFDQFTPEQQQLLSQMMNMLGAGGSLGQGYGQSVDYLKQLMDPNSQAVQQFTQPYMDQFNQQTVPQLAERFAGAGGGMGGGLSSSGFGQSLSVAGGALQNQLASLKAGLGQQAAGQLMNQYGNMTGQALGAQPFGYQYNPGSQGFLGNMLKMYMQGGMPGV